MIRVGLWTDQRAIQLQVNLLDDGMGQIVDGEQYLRVVKFPLSSFFKLNSMVK